MAPPWSHISPSRGVPGWFFVSVPTQLKHKDLMKTYESQHSLEMLSCLFAPSVIKKF